jgi:alpha-L-arabinofuranosidase
VKAYLDNELVHQEVRKPVAKFYAAAGRDLRAKELVLQMVNPSADTLPVAIKLSGARLAGSKAKTITLANASADSENTLDRPDTVVPRTSEFNGVAADFTYRMEPYSLTTLRIPEK